MTYSSSIALAPAPAPVPDSIRAFLEDDLRFATISTLDPDEPDEAERLIRDGFERQERISFHFRPQAVHDHLAG